MSENLDLFVTNARRPDAQIGEYCELLVQEGRIVRLDKSGSIDAPSGAEHIDAKGQLLFASFIDAHTHLRDPGFEYKEDIASGLMSAAHGGFGSVMCMANTNPVNDTPAVTRFMLEKASRHFPYGPDLYPIGALTIGLNGEELAPLGELVAAGCVAFSNDGKPMQNSEILRRGVEYSAMWQRRVIDHCEDTNLAKGAHMNEGETSGYLGIKGQSTVAEALHVARDILMAEYLKLPIHLAHISCRQSTDLIRWAKGRGVAITAETCPHYLFLDESAVNNYNTMAKVNPPLRTRGDINAIREALKDGVLDILATDHAPHAPHEKDVPFDEAPNGFIGFETALPMTYNLVRNGELSERDLERLWCHTPARLFGITCNNFKPGDRASFFLFDTERKWLLSRETIHSKSLNTPWLGQEMCGLVTAHWLNGRRIV